MERIDWRLYPHKNLGTLVRISPYLVSIIILALLAFVLPSYLQTLFTEFLIYAIFALSLNLIWGYTGLISLGHAAYFGAGAYTAGVLVTKFGVESFWLGGLMGILAAVILAAFFGVLALRLSGMYFLLVTLAMAQLVYYVVQNLVSLTGGYNGLTGVPFPNIGISGFTWTPAYYYLFCLIAFIICYFLMYRIVKSPFGQALQGIRENEPRMRALGYNTWLYKYIVFIIGGLFAGVAGVFFCYYLRMLAPSQIASDVSTSVLLMAIIGSMNVFFGPVLGALAIVFLQFYAGLYLPQRWPLIYGAIFVLTILFLPEGIGFYINRYWRKILGKVFNGIIKS